eukprot:CCRYP_011444-RB/>CCRYP_011444-RB protein AED:0.32 eAED:0.32 QI:63/0.5/1/1/0/0.33/3/1540/84
MTGRARAIGGNVILASLLAALSYLPFELIAKSTLIVCIAMFVADPFPTSRLVSVGGPRKEDYTFVAAIPGSHIESIIFEEGIIL